MGVILINFGHDVKVIAQGGFCAILRYFNVAFTCLLAMANLLDGSLHLVYLDRSAWNEYQLNGIAYFETSLSSVSV